MKTFIIGLFSLALLGSGVVLAGHQPVHLPVAKGPEVPIAGGTKAVCILNNGSLIIIVTKDQELVVRPCPGVAEDTLAKLVGLIPEPSGTLGIIQKYKSLTDSDPCYEWTVGGTSYVYCW